VYIAAVARIAAAAANIAAVVAVDIAAAAFVQCTQHRSIECLVDTPDPVAAGAGAGACSPSLMLPLFNSRAKVL